MAESFGGHCVTLIASADLRDKEGYVVAWDGNVATDSAELPAGVLVKGGASGEACLVQVNGIARVIVDTSSSPAVGQAAVVGSTAGVIVPTAIASVAADKFVLGYFTEAGSSVAAGTRVKCSINIGNAYTA